MTHWPRFIPPVGEPILPRLRLDAGRFDWTFGGRYRPIFVDSGTTALRLAISAARRHTGSSGPVWVPAYGCPDILSAAIAAGVAPVLYDVRPDLPFFLQDQHPPNDLVAAIAAHFAGIPHPPDEMRRALIGQGSILIEDSAQRFPMPGETLYGDAVVLSFGRGKPLSLMEGGCLLVKDFLYPHAAKIAEGYADWDSGIRGCIQRQFHDAALHPEIFAVVRRIPGLAIGRVVYRPASAPRRAGTRLAELATRAASAYQLESSSLEQANATLKFVGKRFPDVWPLDYSACGRTPRLTRIPFMATAPESAVAAYEDAVRAGIGATRMYGRAMLDISGAPAPISGPCSNAKSLAARLVTFPVLGQRDIDRLDSDRTGASR